MQTMSGTLKGKFGYMAPEYIKGSIDARADLFALGVIAYELLTSKPLFTGRDDLETLNRVQEMTIAPPSTKNPAVPAEIDDIVMTALARDPAHRWQHATALRNAMTTLTRRLQLVILPTQVVEWIEWLFDQTGTAPSTDPEPHISVHTGSSEYTPVETPVTALAPSDYRIRAASSAPPPNTSHTPMAMPLGSAPRLSAQRSIQPAPVDEPEYRAAVQRYSARHEAVGPPERRSDRALDAALTTPHPLDGATTLPRELDGATTLPRALDAATTIPRVLDAALTTPRPRISEQLATVPRERLDPRELPTTPHRPLDLPTTPQRALDASQAPTMIDVPPMANRTLLDRPVRASSMPPPMSSSPYLMPPGSVTELGPGSGRLAAPSQPSVQPPVAVAPRNHALLALLIVIAAVAAAAVVYFVLPLLT
jgi:hypothetical protein